MPGAGAPPAPSPLLPVSLGSQATAGGEPRNYPNYSLASAAVASAATPSQERPRPGPERGNRRALRPGRRLRRGEPVRPPASEAVMTDKPGRLAALARLITGPRWASSRLLSSAPSKRPPPSVPHPHIWAGSGEAGASIGWESRGAKLSGGFPRAIYPFFHSLTHSPLIHSLSKQTFAASVAAFSVKRE